MHCHCPRHLKNAPILILDEATSALDGQSESYIQKSLKNLMKGKTVMAIAHRLSTLKKMDSLVVMDKEKLRSRVRAKNCWRKRARIINFIICKILNISTANKMLAKK